MERRDAACLAQVLLFMLIVCTYLKEQKTIIGTPIRGLMFDVNWVIEQGSKCPAHNLASVISGKNTALSRSAARPGRDAGLTFLSEQWIMGDYQGCKKFSAVSVCVCVLESVSFIVSVFIRH